ncbi:hypothetical protein AB0K60_30920 [Thermopolyspora sp. NPDC052614]|uniref:hypothetical protein n=1 Tax=Thermopolyspora sp. NPDC052614 TaxID=3155682 RepID=UPI003425BDDA
MRMPTSRQLMMVIAACGGVALLAIVVAALLGVVTPEIAIVLALGGGTLVGILVIGLWVRRLDGKVQRLSERLARQAARPAPVVRNDGRLERLERLEPRLQRVETAVSHLTVVADRLEDRVGTVLATLGEDRVEAVYRHKHYTELLNDVAADLRRVTEDARALVKRAATPGEDGTGSPVAGTSGASKGERRGD